jgi:hypothetical protein
VSQFGTTLVLYNEAQTNGRKPDCGTPPPPKAAKPTKSGERQN